MAKKSEVAAEHEIIGAAAVSGAFERTRDPGAQWFPKAAMGIFLHWGISSVFGNTDLSWGMIQNWPFDTEVPGCPKVTPRQYYGEGIPGFTAARYDPRRWIRAAAEAGVRYAVLTTKHHDGFTLWPSAYTEIGTGQSLGGRDLVGEFVEACREYGVKVGLYYSPPDWYFNRDYMAFNVYDKKTGKPLNFDLKTMDSVPEMPPEHRKAFREHIRGQSLELLTRYGKIDIIWFDGRGVGSGEPDPVTIEEIRGLQPGILINPRMHGHGDFSTPECRLPAEAPEGWWELCHLCNDHGWGYTVHPYKSFEWLKETLLTTRAMGGNFLMNFGPKPDGTMPEQYYERMGQLREWLKTNRAVIFDD